VHCIYCRWRKGTSQDKATSNSGKIKPVALSIVELCLAEGISKQVSKVRELISIKFGKMQEFYNSIKLVGRVWGHSEDIFELG